MTACKTKGKGERGSAILEFAVVSVVIIPLFFGMVSVGINMGTMLQAVQASRDVGHQYANGIDFSQSANQSIAVNLATGTTMTTTGGNGVMILSQLIQVFQADCTAAGLANCPNQGQIVYVNRIKIGNSSLYSSQFSSPPSSIVDSTGNVGASDYLTNSSDVATGFAALLTASGLTLTDGTRVYLSEVYFSTPNLSFLGSPGSQGVYARSIF